MTRFFFQSFVVLQEVHKHYGIAIVFNFLFVSQCDGEDYTLQIRTLRLEAICFLNITSYRAGTNPWGTPSSRDVIHSPNIAICTGVYSSKRTVQLSRVLTTFMQGHKCLVLESFIASDLYPAKFQREMCECIKLVEMQYLLNCLKNHMVPTMKYLKV